MARFFGGHSPRPSADFGKVFFPRTGGFGQRSYYWNQKKDSEPLRELNGDVIFIFGFKLPEGRYFRR
jgi:hypothetical protein